MAALILPSRRVVQPQGQAQLDCAAPLTQGGRIAVTPFSRNLLTAGTNARIHVGPQGFELGVNTLVAGAAFSLSSPNSAGTTGADGFTQLIVFRRFGGATSNPSVFIEETAGGYFRNAFYYNGASWVWRTRDTATGDTGAARDLTLTTPVAGAVEVRAFVVKPGAKRAFRNGRLDNSTATAAAFTATDSSAFQFAHSVSGGSSYSGDSRIALYASINRALSDSEVAALSANPWQLFKPVERRIWVPVSGGGGGVSASGAPADLTLAPAQGSAAGGAVAAGALASLAIVAALGSAVGGAAVSGALAPVALSAAAGSATGGAAATGAPASISLTPAAGTAAGSGGGAVSASGTPAALSLQPAAGTATGGAASAGTPAAITLAPATGTATGSAGGGAAASGAPAALVVFPPAGTAIGGAVAGGSPASISITPAAGTAYDGSVPSINWPTVRLDAAHRSDVPAAHVRLLVRERSVRVAVPSRAVRALVFPEQST